MTDVQVSNARRIWFTALAVIAFWLLAWWGYWRFYDGGGPDSIWRLREVLPSWTIWVIIGSSFAVAPTVLYSIATHGFVLRLLDRGVLLAGGLFATTIGLALWLGESGFRTAVRLPRISMPTREGLIAEVQRHHQGSWLVLLFPIILTTAFVIFGAWRRAVRDAEFGAVGEDE